MSLYLKLIPSTGNTYSRSTNIIGEPPPLSLLSRSGGSLVNGKKICFLFQNLGANNHFDLLSIGVIGKLKLLFLLFRFGYGFTIFFDGSEDVPIWEVGHNMSGRPHCLVQRSWLRMFVDKDSNIGHK